MRFGLVGTGPWAHLAHGPGLVAAEDVELVGVWGRDPAKARELAAALGVAAYADYAALLAEVDALAFAVPPDVQASMATQAARAGKHLLLDKPIAADVPAARTLVEAVDAAGVASVVLFTDRFVGPIRDWLGDVRRTGGWRGGWMRWFSALQEADNPFGRSPWRQERGALWDIGPHAISSLTAALGPIADVTAVGGAADLVVLTFTHESGATSTATLSQFAPPAAASVELTLWGEAGLSPMPDRPDSEALPGIVATALGELIASAAGDRRHPLDVRFGLSVVELIVRAGDQLAPSAG